MPTALMPPLRQLFSCPLTLSAAEVGAWLVWLHNRELRVARHTVGHT